MSLMMMPFNCSYRNKNEKQTKVAFFIRADQSCILHGINTQQLPGPPLGSGPASIALIHAD
jgi:hypothetical protein